MKSLNIIHGKGFFFFFLPYTKVFENWKFVLLKLGFQKFY